MPYRLIAMLEFADQAQALDAYAQMEARATNTLVVGMGGPDEHTSYCEVRDGTETLLDGFFIDTFNIVRPMPYVAPTGDYPKWVTVTGAHDSYPALSVAGEVARVEHNGANWENTHGDGNSWEPGVYGWVQV